MDVKIIGKKLLGAVDEKKLSKIVIEDVVLAILKKVVEDSKNKFDDAAYGYLAPLAQAKGEEVIADLIAKAKA